MIKSYHHSNWLNNLENNNNFKMSVFEHLEELRQRTLKATLFFIIVTCLSLKDINFVSSILIRPALGIKFLQLAPGEYFFATVKVSIYTGILFSSPFIIYQLVLFILPGLTTKEAQVFLPLVASSILLFFSGLYFAYNILIPASLYFFINYGSDIVEPLWSFEQYFDFVILVLISTGITFQIPILQILIGLLNIVSSRTMLESWKYVLFFSTILGAILTPSTDPITQLSLSVAIVSLYFISAFIVKSIEK
uniref:Sec-independent translocase component C n=1 Tax=Neogoniolithon spectabile TaxID=231755 RepID=A0A3G3MGY8_9FLOR|nr:Sec-independent translocase component C [Neogoniolithon spectabile]AYR06062.1 Sec-independent translocase component C [Neogoniolithon spectabile]